MSVDLSQEHDSPPPETLRDSRTNSEIPEKILRSQNNLRDPRKNSEISENQQPEPLPELDSALSQTIQTNKTIHTYPDCDTHTDYWSIAEEEENNQVEQYISSLNQESNTEILLILLAVSHNLKVEKNVSAGSIVVKEQKQARNKRILIIHHPELVIRFGSGC